MEETRIVLVILSKIGYIESLLAAPLLTGARNIYHSMCIVITSFTKHLEVYVNLTIDNMRRTLKEWKTASPYDF